MIRKFILTEGKWHEDILWKFFISLKVPKLETCSAVFCIPIYHDEVVLVRHPTRGWGFPGGHIEHGETLVDAASRELFEETRLTIQNPKFFGYKKIIHIKPIKHRDYSYFYPFPFSYIPYCLTRLQEPLNKIIGKNSEIELVSFAKALLQLAGPEKNDIILKYLIESKILFD